ncbi:MAG: hypothetical protein AAGJ87_02240, partial [Pseudomonadota bacterium]
LNVEHVGECGKADIVDVEEGVAKAIWLACPQFQESFCRKRITTAKRRGFDAYGSRNWLKRRFTLSKEELTVIFSAFWTNPAEMPSSAFFEILTIERIAESQLTPYYQEAVKRLLAAHGYAEGPATV